MPLPEAIRKRIQDAQKRIGSSGTKWLTLEAGKPVDIHVLFGEYGMERLWYVKQGIHYLGEYSKNQTRTTCPRITADRECPICGTAKQIREEVSAKKLDLEAKRRSLSKEDAQTAEQEIAQLQDMADQLYASVRYVFNVVVRGESQVRLFNCPKTIFEDIFAAWAKNAEAVDMFDPKMSYYFTVSRTGEGQQDTKYAMTPNMVAVPIASTQEEIDKLVAARYNLDEEIKVPTLQEVQDAFDKYLGNAPSTPAEAPKEAPKPTPTPPPPAPTPTVQTPMPTTGAGPDSPAARLRAKLAGGK